MRLFNFIYAKLFGYFWLPCRVCGRNFGGHEVGSWTPLIVEELSGQHAYCVCSRECGAEAEKANDANGRHWPTRM